MRPCRHLTDFKHNSFFHIERIEAIIIVIELSHRRNILISQLTLALTPLTATIANALQMSNVVIAISLHMPNVAILAAIAHVILLHS